MSRLILFILDLSKGIFRLLSIDYDQLRAIVQIKLLMDKRRKPAGFMQQNKSNDEVPKYQYWLALFVYAVMGTFVGLLVFAMSNVYWATSIVFAYIMVMTIMTLITDFASIVMDNTDYAILSPRPVDSRTVWMARLVHVVVYVLTLTFSVALMPIVFSGFKYGILGLLVFILLVIVSALIGVFLTNLLYVMLIRFTSEARIKQVITYAQVVFTIVFVAGYQIIPRMIRMDQLENIKLEIATWQFFAPPFWLGGLMEAFVNRHFEMPYPVFLFLAILFPVGIVYLMNRFINKSFNRKLMEINDGGDKTSEAEQVEDITKRPLSERLSTWVARNPIEKMGFELTWKLTNRDQKFKLRTFPSLGVMIPTIFVFLRGENLGTQNWQYILVLYVFSFAINAFYSNSQFSDDYKASWFYNSTAISQPGYILVGALKAIFIKFILPIYVVLSAFIVWMWGWEAVPNVILAFLNNLLFILTLVLVGPKRLPFSHAPSESQQASNFGIALLMMLMGSLIGFAHYGLSRFPIGVWIAVPTVAILVFVLLKTYSQTTWEQIRTPTSF